MPKDNLYSNFEQNDSCQQAYLKTKQDISADLLHNLLVVQRWLAREAAQPRPREKRAMTDEEFVQVLDRVAHAMTLQELADIRHESPAWDHMSEKMCGDFNRAVEARRVFLKELDWLRHPETSTYDRAEFIAIRTKHTDPNSQELVAIARAVQEQVTLNMSVEEIYQKPDMLASFRQRRSSSNGIKNVEQSNIAQHTLKNSS